MKWLSGLKERQISRVIPSFLFVDGQVKRVPCAELGDGDKREAHEFVSGTFRFE